MHVALPLCGVNPDVSYLFFFYLSPEISLVLIINLLRCPSVCLPLLRTSHRSSSLPIALPHEAVSPSVLHFFILPAPVVASPPPPPSHLPSTFHLPSRERATWSGPRPLPPSSHPSLSRARGSAIDLCSNSPEATLILIVKSFPLRLFAFSAVPLLSLLTSRIPK